MSWSLLQSVGPTPTAASPLTATYTSNVSAGTKLIAYISNSYSAAGQITSVKDGAGNSLTQLVDIAYPSGQGELAVYAMDTPAGDVGAKPTITVVLAGTYGCCMIIEEVSGLAAGATLAAMVDGTPATNSGTASPVTVSGYTSAAASEYLVGVVGDAGYSVTYTLSGYTPDPSNIGSNGYAELNVGYKNSAGSAETLSWAISAASTWGAALFAFKLAGGAASSYNPAGFAPPVPPGWFPGADGRVSSPGDIPYSGDPQPAWSFAAPPPAVVSQAALQAAPPPVPPGWFPGCDGRVNSPGDIPYSGDPQPGWGLHAPTPPPPGGSPAGQYPQNLIPPGWFPGSDSRAAHPGGIPFWQQPLSPAAPPSTTPPYIAGLAGTPGAGWFADQHGSPRLWVATETWGLPVNAGAWSGSGGGTWQQDFDNFFSARAAQGFTVCLTDPVWAPTGEGAHGGNTWDGLTPLAGGSTDPTSAGLNPSFWARIDYMLASALRNGITIGMVICNIGDDVESGLWQDTWTTAQWTAWGALVAARYIGQPNLIWLVGNDAFSPYSDAQFNAVQSGITGTGDTHMFSAWYDAECTSRYITDTNTSEDWGVANAAFNFTYSYNAGYWIIEYAYGEVINQGAANLLPVTWGDGYFYNGSSGGGYSATYDRALRQEWWWCLASGSRGVLGEAENVYPWNAGSCVTAVTGDWFFPNNAPSIVTAFTGLGEWWELLPDLSSALVTGGRGTRVAGLASGGGGGQYEPAFTNSYVAASMTPDGKLAVLYLPNATTVTVNTALLATGWAAIWVDPVTGATSSAGAGPTFNSSAKGSNSQGDPDWALVFQPGSVNASVTTTVLSGTAAFAAATVSAGETVTTSALTCAASFPAPTISAGTGITPAALTVSAGFTAPTVGAGAVITPAALACPAAFTAPTVAAGETVTTTALAVSTTFPAPALRADEILTTAVLAGTTALPPPAIAAGSTLATTVLACSAAFPAPALQAGQTAAPASLAASAAFPAPTISAGGSANVSPAALACSAAFTAPAIRADANLTTAALAGSASFPAVTVSAGEGVAPSALSGAAAFPAATVGAGSGVTTTAMAGTASFPAVTVAAGSGVTTTALAASAAFSAPGVSAGSGVTTTALAGAAAFPAAGLRADANLTVTALSVSAAFPVPSISAGGSASVSPSALACGTAFPAPGIGASETASAAALAVSASFPAPALAAGSVVVPAVLAVPASFPAAGVSAGSAVTPASLAGAASFPAPSVSAGGSASVTPATLGSSAAFPAAAPSAGAMAATAVLACPASFPAAAPNTGSVVAAAAFTGSAAFPAPGITAGSAVGVVFSALTSRQLWSASAARQLWASFSARNN